MKVKKIISLLLILTTLLSVSTTAFAMPNKANELEQLDQLEQNSYDYNRQCDYKTGVILEKYDTELNGQNSIDYVSLATSMSAEKDDRIAAMNMIIEIYDDVDNDEQIYLRTYIESYAPYTEEANLNEFCDLLNNQSISLFAAYNRTNAVNYALTYYQNYNSAYPNMSSLGGDCANFVSQCLLAGGKAMEGDWYIYRKNNLYNKPTTTEQLDASWRLADPSPWISAKQFNNYWSKKCTTYEYSTSDYVKDHSTIFNKAIYKGDAIQLLKPVLWWYEGYHTMIIVGYDFDNKDFIFAAHTSNTNNTKLLTTCGKSNYAKYHVKFFSMA